MNARTLLLVVATLLPVTVLAQAPAPASSPPPNNVLQVTVLHDAAPPPTYVDLGEPGESVGDQRIWHFAGVTPNGAPVVMDWIMTTTRIDDTAEGIESRVTLGVFSFSGDDVNQLLLEGVGLYPAAGSTFKADSSLTRAIIGGTGRFRGARGEVVSTHLEDDTWQHVFRIRRPVW